MYYTLHQLEIFKKITELKSITKASEELHLTQPAVSIQLKKFQDQFSVPLTEIVGRQLYVTDFGYEIAEAASKILQEVEAINYKTLSYQGKIAGKLKISIVSTAKYVIPYFLSNFIRENEGVELIMDVTNKAKVLESLDKNEVDFSMMSVIPDELKIDRIELLKNKLFLVSGKQFEMEQKEYSKDILENVPLIFREKGSATRKAMEDFIYTNKIPTQKKIELTSNEALKQAVIAGLGMSIMPLIGIKNELKNGDLQIIPVDGLPITTNWNLVWLKSKKFSPTAAAFLENLQETKEEIIKNSFSWFENY